MSAPQTSFITMTPAPQTLWHNEHRKFLLLLGAVILFRVVLALLLPITGDEAYFVVWAKQLAGGYYDHPPAVSWLIAPFWNLFGNNALAVRFSSIALVPIAMILAYDLMLRLGLDVRRAYTATLIVALQPLLWLSFLITTDTPLYLSGIFFVYCVVRYIHTPGPMLLLGAVATMMVAVQSKYFFVFLCLSYFVATVLVNKAHGWKLFAAVTAGAVVSGALHLWWNAEHCYPTILFNFINRQQVNDHWPDTMISFWLMFLWIAIPLLHRSTLALFRASDATPQVRAASRTLLVFWLLPFAAFLLIAIGRLVGLHYIVPLVLCFFLWLGVRASDKVLGSVLKLSIWSSAVHLACIVALVLLPFSFWESNRFYRGIVTHFKTAEILKQFDQGDAVVAAVNYSIGAVLEFHDAERRPWSVWGGGSFQGRQDDFVTDWSAYRGRDFQVFSYEPMAQHDFARYFAASSEHPFQVAGVTFYRWQGKGFDYELYRTEVLLPNLLKNYRRPAWLKSLACPLETRYQVAF